MGRRTHHTGPGAAGPPCWSTRVFTLPQPVLSLLGEAGLCEQGVRARELGEDTKGQIALFWFADGPAQALGVTHLTQGRPSFYLGLTFILVPKKG